MSEQDRANCFDKAVEDIIRFSTHTEPPDEDHELLGLASEIIEAMPLTTARPFFREELRRELASYSSASSEEYFHEKPTLKRRSLLDRLSSVFGSRNGGRLVAGLATAAATIAVVVGAVYTLQSAQRPYNVASEMAGMEMKASPEAVTAPGVGSDDSTAVLSSREEGQPSLSDQPATTVGTSSQPVAYGPLPRLLPEPQSRGGGQASNNVPGQVSVSGPMDYVERVALDLTSSVLPNEAQVYLLEEAKSSNPRRARELAESFGFTTPFTETIVVSDSNAASDEKTSSRSVYDWKEGGRSLHFDPLSNHIYYANYPANQDDTGSTNGPTLSQHNALSEAKLFAESVGLLSAEHVSVAEYKHDSSTWRVRFESTIDGVRVLGGGVELELDADLRVLSLSSQSRQVEGSSVYPLKSLEDAVSSVQSGNVLMWDGIPIPTAKPYDLVTITQISIVYWEKLPGELQRYLQPVFAITGRLDGDDGPRRFTVYLSAVSEQYLSR